MNEVPSRRTGVWHDLAGVVGVALITGGVAMIYVPAALIVCGALLLTGAVLAARRA